MRSVVRDFPAMLERVSAMARLARAGASRYEADEVEEVVDFLAWLQRGEFVFLGAREYDFSEEGIALVHGSGLGILADESKSAFGRDGGVPFSELPDFVRRSALGGDLLLVDKANAPAPVHRRERMDYIGVRRVDSDGAIIGMSRVIGLFTTKAYAEPASETPLLGRKLRQCLEGLGLIEGSHDYKAAVALYDTFPKDELFAAPVEDLTGCVRSLMALEGTRKVRLLGRRDADGRNASLILTLPRDALRRRARGAGARAVPAPLRDVEGGDAPRPRRQRALPRALPRPRARRAPGAGAARTGARGHRALAHVGRRAARPAGLPARPGRGAAPRGGVAGPLPRSLQGLHVGRVGGLRHRVLRAAYGR